jgi:hypothetical protein
MEATGHSGEGTSLTATTGGESGLSTSFEEDIEFILDVPYMSFNRVGGEYIGEVVLSGDEVVDRGRVQTVLDAGTQHGQTVYARKHGEYGTILIFFTSREVRLGGA